MSRRALVVLNDDSSITVDVEDGYNVDLADDATWLVIDEKAGGQLIVPARLVISIHVVADRAGN